MSGTPILRILASAALIAAAGCGRDIAPRMTLGTSGSTTPHVWTSQAQLKPEAEPRVAGYHHAVVHAAVNGQEVTGATCRVLAPDMDLTFQTPAKIYLPVMRRPVAPATMHCRFSDMEGTKTLHADRNLERRPAQDKVRMGISLTKVSSFVSSSLNMWSYLRNGSEITIDLVR